MSGPSINAELLRQILVRQVKVYYENLHTSKVPFQKTNFALVLRLGKAEIAAYSKTVSGRGRLKNGSWIVSGGQNALEELCHAFSAPSGVLQAARALDGYGDIGGRLDAHQTADRAAWAANLASEWESWAEAGYPAAQTGE